MEEELTEIFAQPLTDKLLLVWVQNEKVLKKSWI